MPKMLAIPYSPIDGNTGEILQSAPNEDLLRIFLIMNVTILFGGVVGVTVCMYHYARKLLRRDSTRLPRHFYFFLAVSFFAILLGYITSLSMWVSLQ
jgi:hypothetical protein